MNRRPSENRFLVFRRPSNVFRFRLSVPVPLCIAAATRWRRLFPFRCRIARRAGSGGRWPFPEPP
ncbi:hypothetical protein NEIELOOT_00884 [Neisseria elongata subsp. glycolytica ATCC 29315]|uniref:Uncharacterized protein n=1 Tax=Neisseria elongata subsp. glycolytica ATCC 29315 TaxID=546263 RepID=D4DP99_NEIEG|nr:hypothetical protein NEIELOOT_00884 [Neisseria elongata subsp. glycolytica ATCC 29315]